MESSLQQPNRLFPLLPHVKARNRHGTSCQNCLPTKAVTEEDLVITALNGIGADFKELAVGIRARETQISFEDLMDKMDDYESFLKKLEAATDYMLHSANSAFKPSNNQGAKPKQYNKSSPNTNRNNAGNNQRRQRGPNTNKVTCQFCDHVGHSAKQCRQIKLKQNQFVANNAATTTPRNNNWIADTGASHHVTSKMENLESSTDELYIGDGSVSNAPLEILFTDVWGPVRVTSSDGFKYYVSFVDYYTRYTWLFPMTNKSDVFNIFKKFKVLVERLFNRNILTIYSDCGVISTVPSLQAVHSCPENSSTQLEMASLSSALSRSNNKELVPPPKNRNIIGSKWVFHVKTNPDGSVSRFKARLVAKGFSQRLGLDYKDTFSPVIKPVTVRLVLCIAVTNNWPLHQLDINNAFLQGDLSKEVYMKQPAMFVDKNKPHHVCKLRKAIYGLKQAPKAWYLALSNFLKSYGFTNSVADTSLFIFHNDDCLLYMLVYVDDIVLTGNNSEFLQHFIQDLSTRFALKDLGRLNYSLGVEVTYNRSGIILSRHKYIHDILKMSNMEGAKLVSTPLSTSVPLTLHDGTAPTEAHLFALKRVLRYIKGTVMHGLHLKRQASPSLVVYTDSDWAGNPDDRKSTYFFIIYLGNTPISWSSKKQKTVARSSTEAEFRSIAATVSELTWIQSIMSELQVRTPKVPLVLCDNASATYTCANPVFHTRMKHLALDYFFVQEKVQQGLLQVKFIPSKVQLADALTKPLSVSRFHSLLSKIGVCSTSTILREDNRLGLQSHSDESTLDKP
ncbi:Integrase, catalytic core [Corchorus capsularis]|uniref:Integrase, catalytic core n=1 Tax=Corchorus capsularis TaxID=210143 RepID=A0A1R3IIP8_COCAP|nr:Integrase, catalytic core [Corchorus capsularis]